MKKLISLVTVLLLVALLVVPVQAEELGSSQYSNVASESRSGVVRILAITELTADGYIYYSTGSGVAVGEEGEPTSIFVTNNHVIDEALEVYILLDNDWKESIVHWGGVADNKHAVSCEVIYTPGNPDYAILEADREVDEREALALMRAELAFPGDTVFALGYPGVSDEVTDETNADIDSMTVTRGTISRFTTYESQKSDAIQIDADINHGNSGGPLITEEGYVIGLNTWGVGNEDGMVNLALQIDYVIDALDELIEDGDLEDFEFTEITDREKGTSDDDDEEFEITTPMIVGAVAVVAVIAFIVIKKKREKDQYTPPAPAPKPEPAPEEPKAEPVPAGPRPTGERFVMEFDISGDVKGGGFTVPSGGNDGGVTRPASSAGSDSGVTRPVSTGSSAAFCVVGVDGYFAGRTFPVSGEVRVGRNAGSGIQYPSDIPGVSGSHCVLQQRDNGIVLIDQNSTYGTLLPNGTKLNPNQKYLLKPGDMFCLGNQQQKFRVERSGSAAAASASASPSYTLTGLDGHFAGRRFPLNRETRLGRNGDNDVVFAADVPGISGSHCLLIPRADGVVLIDQNSTYGTFQENGNKLNANQKYLLKRGDGFCMGSMQQRFRIE